MDHFRVLIVEDDEDQVQTWKRQIPRFKAMHSVTFIADYAESLAEAEEFLESKKYDAAIVDVRLKREDGVKDATHDGNRVRKLIFSSELAVVAHITGEPTALDLDNSPGDKVVKVFTKGDHTGDDDEPVQTRILEWLLSHASLIETLRTTKAVLKSQMANLFCTSIWPRWENWKSETSGESFVANSVARHISAHLYAELLRVSSGKVHPEEWYFLPPCIDIFQTGDIVKDGDDFRVLITPRCDLERINKGDSLLFAKMENISQKWSEQSQQLDDAIADQERKLAAADNDQQKEKCKEKINRFYSEFRQEFYGHKKNSARLHFLPEIRELPGTTHGPFYVDFTNITSVLYGSETADRLRREKKAAIAPEFIPSLVQRLGSYISRIGSPDYSHIY